MVFKWSFLPWTGNVNMERMEHYDILPWIEKFQSLAVHYHLHHHQTKIRYPHKPYVHIPFSSQLVIIKARWGGGELLILWGFFLLVFNLFQFALDVIMTYIMVHEHVCRYRTSSKFLLLVISIFGNFVFYNGLN